MKVIYGTTDGEPILQGSDAWKQLRVGMLTASVMSDILPGKKGGYLASREKALLSMVWERLSGIPETGFFGGKYVKDGIEREPYARMAVEGRFNYVVEETAFIQHNWMKVGVSLDGWVPELKRTVEIKCPKDTTHMGYLMLDEAPEEYKVQIQTQLWIAECDACDFVSYHPDAESFDMHLHVIQVPRDEPFIAMLEKEAALFLAEVNVRVKDYEARRVYLNEKTEDRLKR